MFDIVLIDSQMLDPHDVEGLADAFMQVISNENLRQEMIAKGLEQAKKFN
jgi:glycosyltransferase involved in cell wall biosynthesis